MTLVRAIVGERRRTLVVLSTVVVLMASGFVLWLGPGPAPHHVTRDMAVKVAVTHLLQPGEHAQIQAKLARQWQLTLLSANDGGNLWSNQLIWFVLVPGGHFSHPGPCCGPPPKTRWDVVLVEDHAGSAQLDGVISGGAGDRPTWYDLLPDLSGGQ
jgi:hypothetical protein